MPSIQRYEPSAFNKVESGNRTQVLDGSVKLDYKVYNLCFNQNGSQSSLEGIKFLDVYVDQNKIIVVKIVC